MMKNKSVIKILLIAFGLILAFNFGTLAQKTDCSKTTDEEIVKAIYEKIKVKYADQIKHINVRSKDGVVTIEGWVTTEKIKKDIGKIAKKVKCVKQVINELTIGKGGGCGPGMKQCGDICIPEKETCNICLIQKCED
jgi:osmotically-inducible protein OsmY